MPKALHDKLEREAEQRGLRGERKDAYVYGTLNKMEENQRSKCRVCGRPIHVQRVFVGGDLSKTKLQWVHSQTRQDVADRIRDEHYKQGESSNAKP